MVAKHLALVALTGVACSKARSERDADCAKLRDIVERAVEGVPRRYRDAAIHDRARRQLQQIALADAAIQRAVLDEHATYDDLEELCAPATSDRERDCAYIRARLEHMLFVVVPDRARGTGILDTSALAELEQRSYRDAAVQQAAIAMAREARVAFFTPSDRADAASIDARSRAAYDELARVCNLPPRP